MRRHTLDLTGADRVALERTRDRNPRSSVRERASAMLQIADGQSARQVARHGLDTPRKPETVCRWLAAERAHGLADLRQWPRSHRGFPPKRGRHSSRRCISRPPPTGSRSPAGA